MAEAVKEKPRTRKKLSDDPVPDETLEILAGHVERGEAKELRALLTQLSREYEGYIIDTVASNLWMQNYVDHEHAAVYKVLGKYSSLNCRQRK